MMNLSAAHYSKPYIRKKNVFLAVTLALIISCTLYITLFASTTTVPTADESNITTTPTTTTTDTRKEKKRYQSPEERTVVTPLQIKKDSRGLGLLLPHQCLPGLLPLAERQGRNPLNLVFLTNPVPYQYGGQISEVGLPILHILN